MHKSTILRFFAAGCVSTVALAVAKISEGDFSSDTLTGLEPESFEDETRDRIVSLDGRRVSHAQCDASASGLVLKREIDLTQTPILHWSWRVDRVYPGLEEKIKAGDDYPARIYIIHDGGWLKWRSRAVDYVWSSSRPVGESWPNAFVSQAMMVAVRSGPPARPVSLVRNRATCAGISTDPSAWRSTISTPCRS